MATENQHSFGDLHCAALLWVSFKYRDINRPVSDGTSIGACHLTYCIASVYSPCYLDVSTVIPDLF